MGRAGTFGSFLEWVLDLRVTCDIPSTLEGVGVREAQIEAFAAASVLDPSTGTNPVPIDASGYARLYRRALTGDLSA
jgi:alcohol dehydrogenase class IV